MHYETIEHLKESDFKATRRIYETDSEIGVLALTMFDDDDSVFAAMRAARAGTC